MTTTAYTPSAAFGADIQKEGEQWTLVLVRELKHPPEKVWKALTDPELLKKLNVTGALEPLVLPPAEFAALMKQDYEKYGKLVRDVGVKIEQ